MPLACRTAQRAQAMQELDVRVKQKGESMGAVLLKVRHCQRGVDSALRARLHPARAFV